MKKTLSCILTLALLISLLSGVGASATTTGYKMTVGSTSGAAGESVTVEVVLENNPGISSAVLEIDYDQTRLMLDAATIGTTFSSGAFTNINLPYVTFVRSGDVAEDDVLLTLSFTIKNEAALGEAYVTVLYEEGDITNYDEEDINFEVMPGKIVVECAHNNTVNVPEDPADCDEGGYTAGVYCNDCKTYISGHETTLATGNHTDADGKWESNEVNHFRTCACGYIFDTATHSGGTANCKEKAKCSVCGAEYGQLNKNNHAGGTTVVNVSEPNHKTQQAGYTGDTKCLGCGEIITYGQPIEPDAHTPANVWSNDGEYHWKECTVVGCGIVIDGSKALHSSDKTENRATCQKQAICDICGVSYGTVASHNYTAKEKKQDALKASGNCRDEAVYYYSCSACGKVENNDSYTFEGDKIATTHIGGTTLVNQSEANHKTQTDGYTGDTKCNGCGEILSYGQSIPAGAHTPANVWSNDGEYHWKECTVVGCGIVIDGSKAAHSSTGANVATCNKKAVCDVCNTSYGDFAAHDWNTTAWEKDASGHWHKCNTTSCAEKNDFAGHTPDHLGGATEEYPIKCTVCGWIIEQQLAHNHAFDQEVVDEQYLASAADCTDPAKYYKSCRCGEKGTETFTSGTKLGHTEGTAWEKDATNHWHICTVAGCGTLIESSKAAHTPDHEGGATEEYAIKCSVCGWIIEQQLAHTHVFDREVVDERYMASGATCLKPATYYKSCACGEKDTETFENGGVIDHTEGTEWKSDADNHWHICTIAGCGVVIESSKVAHTPDRAESTETDAVKCSVCGYVITPALGHTHAYGTDWESDANNHWNECACGDKANIADHKDDNKDGKCDVCEYNVGIPADPSNPQTGDNSMISLWNILLCVSALGVIATTVLSKKKSFR